MPDPPACQVVDSYHVYVDGVLKVTVKTSERTRALVEGVDLNRVIIFYSLLAYLFSSSHPRYFAVRFFDSSEIMKFFGDHEILRES